ncbi:MAG: hypothetical protein HY903_02135 [Deltaproteobacteria bacterium]|nr:hypothetical protein [Deltaproteobacteria bacterium]
MLLTALSVVAVVGGGTYAVEGDVTPFTVADHTKAVICHPIDGGDRVFGLEGPANAKLQVWVDVAGGVKKAVAVQISMDLDGKPKTYKVRAKADKKISYEPAREVVPGKVARPLPLKVGPGAHKLHLSMTGSSGCVELQGLTLVETAAAPAPTAAALPTPPAPPPAAPVAAPPADPVVPASPPAPAPAALVAAPESEPAAAPVAIAPVAAPEPMPALEPPPTKGEVHEIKAAEVGAVRAEATPAALPAAAAGKRELLRAGPYVGGLLPRGDLRPTLSVGLTLEAPLPLALSGFELAVYGAGGWSPMRQQQEAIIPGRGQGQVIQNSLVLPFDVGARVRFVLGLPVQPYASAALAIDVSRTEIQAFSLPPDHQNDVAFGVAAAGGVYLPAGPGGLLAELRYRETRANLGALGDVVEERLANTSLFAAYLVAF